jgi:cytidylate kinase
MIITLGWHHGAGKSTIWAKLGEYFGYKRYSTWDFMRALAMERGISLIDLGREAEWDGGIIDAILDDRQIKLWETEDDFIIDGRLAFHFIPKAIKVFLTVSPEEAARRIFADQTRQGVETHETIEHAVTNIQIRRQSEDDRYMKYYGLHIYDMWLYDIVIDTTGRDPDTIFDELKQKIHELSQ